MKNTYTIDFYLKKPEGSIMKIYKEGISLEEAEGHFRLYQNLYGDKIAEYSLKIFREKDGTVHKSDALKK